MIMETEVITVLAAAAKHQNLFFAIISNLRSGRELARNLKWQAYSSSFRRIDGSAG